MNLNEYLSKRHDMITEAVAREKLAGNFIKESNERNALAEIHGVMDFIRRFPATKSNYMERNKVKILSREQVRRGDKLLFTIRKSDGNIVIQKATAIANSYATEDLTNPDGCAYINMLTGTVFNNP